MEPGKKKGERGMGMGWLLLILVIWIVLQVYVLPKMGVST